MRPILEEWIEMVENDFKVVISDMGDFIENPRNQK
jgi:hypothetical protein